MHTIDPDRRVGAESRKTFGEKLQNGFFERFMMGCGVEVGFNSAETILPGCTGIGLGTPGYDGVHIPVHDEFYDYLYTSHCLEHVSDSKAALIEWMRVVKRRGHIVIVVPHRDLYEKKLTLPSLFSGEHLRFYTPGILLTEMESTYPINSYRVRHLRDNDEGHEYTDPPEMHGRWGYEFEVVIQKL